MKHFFLIPFLFLAAISISVQAQNNKGKYPSLFWEITGNGMKSPSYLFGTMHVSSKVAFNLSDSFYLAIQKADVVALETNPVFWQEEMNKYEFEYTYAGINEGFKMPPNDYLTKNSLKTQKYEKFIERALYINSTAIDNLLYRSYGNAANDFEEDTFLDMYIYQCGKKWGKKIAGVENYGRSMEIMGEAYADASKEKKKKQRSYNDVDEKYAISKMEEAYRKGDLDRLDSIQVLNRNSEAYDEKFIYLRNEIQANSIDTILKKGNRLFVGVGAAHLPGDRGVIEMLRKMGYQLRPIFMNKRDTQYKEEIEKIRVPVKFSNYRAADGFFSVQTPGNLYKNTSLPFDAFETRQFADMSNGSYYMVTRVKTSALFFGHSPQVVLNKVDSLLYENIPGKIITKEKIEKNGYKGFDIVNKTRRGDIQRYQIFVTPYEVFVFKMSGNGEYVQLGNEADVFFNSIVFYDRKPLDKKMYKTGWGGFSVNFGNEPTVYNNGNWVFETQDEKNGTNLRVMRTDVINYDFLGEDKIDLALLDESFGASDFIARNISRKYGKWQHYPSLEAKYIGVDSSTILVKYVLKGPHYFTIVAQAKKEQPSLQQFLQSFEITPFEYANNTVKKDTNLFYTVQTAIIGDSTIRKIKIPQSYNSGTTEDYPKTINEDGAVRSDVIKSDSTGEQIFVTFFKGAKYNYKKDSATAFEDFKKMLLEDSSWSVKVKSEKILPNNIHQWEVVMNDTGSSRSLWAKVFIKDDVSHMLISLTDTVSAPSSFVKDFYASFLPYYDFKTHSPYINKTKLFVQDFNSADSVVKKRASEHLFNIQFDSADLPLLKDLVSTLSWQEKNYMELKVALLKKFGNIKSKESSDYLSAYYHLYEDTIQFQYAILNTLLAQKTDYSFGKFQEIIKKDPPVLIDNINSSENNTYDYYSNLFANVKIGNSTFLNNLYDSLALTKKVLPDLLALMTLEDYKPAVMDLLSQMVDSSIISATDYANYYDRFLLEAKHELRKQSVREKNKAIKKAEDEKVEDPINRIDRFTEEATGNSILSQYANLLVPFWDKEESARRLLQQMLNAADKELKYDVMIKLLQHKKSINDSLFSFFANDKKYAYRLYNDLTMLKQNVYFPSHYFVKEALAKSKLYSFNAGYTMDTVAYLEKLPMELKGKKGDAYFFKYKTNAGDVYWKIAMVGMISSEKGILEFMDEKQSLKRLSSADLNTFNNRYDITRLTETKIQENEPLLKQLQEELKKAIYSKYKSAIYFYDVDDYDMEYHLD